MAVRRALEPLVREYRAWIGEKKGDVERLEGRRRETGEELLRAAGRAADRIELGISSLAEDADALDAFRMANRAVARALTKRLPDIGPPRWRAFQLAFILLNLPGLADPEGAHRETVDLLFFPTGAARPKPTSDWRLSLWC